MTSLQAGGHNLRDGRLAAALMNDRKAHLEGGRFGSSIGEGQEGMARLLWQLHHFGMEPISHVADQGNALLQVHLQGQQAVAAPVSAHHGCVHPLQLSALT